MSQPQSPEVPSATSGSGTSASGLVPAAVDTVHLKQLEKAQDGGWGWVVVFGSCICHFFLIGINRSMGIVYLLLQEQFDATGKQTALAASIFVSFRALGGPVASKLSDRFGCRAVTVVGGVLLCVGLLLSAFAFNITNVYITLGVVAGTGGVLVFSPSYIAVSHWFDKKKGKAMSLSTLGTGFGSIVMGPVMMALVAYYGYFGTMLIAAGLMLHNSVGGALYRSPPKNRLLQGVIVVAVKADKKDVDLKNETVVVAADKGVITSGKVSQNVTMLRAMPVEKTDENALELSVFSDNTPAEKAGNSIAIPAEKTAKELEESAEDAGENCSEFSVKLEEMPSEPGAFLEKSSESVENFELKTDGKFSDADLNTNDDLSLVGKSKQKSQAPNKPIASADSAETFPAFDKGTTEDIRDTAKLDDPHSTNGWKDNPFPAVNMSAPVDIKVPLPNSQLTFNPEVPAYKSTLKDDETAKNDDVVPRRCLDRCPSPLRVLSFFKSSLWFNVPFILYCTMVTATQGCIQAVLIFLPGCGRELGATRQQASLLLTVFGAADMVGRFVFGFVFDLKPLRSRRTHLYTAVAASFAAMAVLLGFMPTYLSLAVVTALVAFFEGGAHSQRATNVTELVEPSQMSIGVGLVIFSQGLGNFYGPLVGGALKDRTGSFSTSFIFGGTTLLCACLLTVLFSVVRSQIDKRKKLKAEDTKVDIS